MSGSGSFERILKPHAQKWRVGGSRTVGIHSLHKAPRATLRVERVLLQVGHTLIIRSSLRIPKPMYRENSMLFDSPLNWVIEATLTSGSTRHGSVPMHTRHGFESSGGNTTNLSYQAKIHSEQGWHQSATINPQFSSLNICGGSKAGPRHVRISHDAMRRH